MISIVGTTTRTAALAAVATVAAAVVKKVHVRVVQRSNIHIDEVTSYELPQMLRLRIHLLSEYLSNVVSMNEDDDDDDGDDNVDHE